MIAQRTTTRTTKSVVHSDNAAVQKAIRLLSRKSVAQRWVCEVCGMLHTGPAPDACDSCGVSSALVEYKEIHREMNSHW